MSWEPAPTLSSMSALSPRPPPLGATLAAALGVVVCALAAAAGVASVLAPPPEARRPHGDVAHARAFLSRLAFPRPVLKDARDVALDLVAAEARADGAHVERRHGITPVGATLLASDDIVALVRGTGGGGRVAIVAHADSVPNVAAAGDDGFGVAVALEALRALAAEKLAGDVVVVVTGQEELCVSCGAAVLDAKDGPFDAVINLDSGGNRGPFALYESVPGNAQLTRALAASPAFSSSLVDGFSRVLGPAAGRTELAAFVASSAKPAHPVAGVGLGLLGGRRCYHTPCDDLALVDVNALGAAVDAVTRAARAVASGSPASTREDALLVALPGRTLALPARAGLSLAGAVALLGLALAVACGFRRFGHFALGVVAFPAAAVAAGALSFLVRAAAALALGPAVIAAHGPLVDGAAALAGFAAAVVAAQALGRGRTLAFAGGTASWWAVVVIGASVASLELGAAVAACAIFVVAGAAGGAVAGTRFAPAPLLLGAAGPFLCAQAAAVVALTAADLDDVVAGALFSVACALAAVAVAPLAARTFSAVPWMLAAACVAGAVALVVVAGRAGAFDAAHPQPASLSYAEGPAGAFLFTVDDPAAAPVLARLGPRASVEKLDRVIPGLGDRRAVSVAPAHLAAPRVDLVDVAPTAVGKTWRLALYSNRGARELRLTVHGNADARPRAFRMQGQALAPCPPTTAQPCTVTILGVTSAILDVELIGSAPPEVTVVDVGLGLPASLAHPWPPGVADSASGARSFAATRTTLRAP